MKKVSIISPCYNGEKHLEYHLKSLLDQDYKNVEYFFIDDGSTDKTKDIFFNYKSKLEEKGWSVEYIYQENAGQAAALNKGLALFTGDYLIWPDSDDILYPNHLSKKVELMENNPNSGLGFCKLDVVNIEQKDVILYSIERVEENSSLFEDLLVGNRLIYQPIGIIARTSAFLAAIPTRQIYANRGGQNFQMLLPIAQKYESCYTQEILGKYVLSPTSHSKTTTNQYYKFKQIIANTILSLVDFSNIEKSETLIKIFDWLASLSTKRDVGYSFYLFGIIPIITKKTYNRKTVYIILNIFPIIKIKNKKVYLFNCILAGSIKEVDNG